MNHDEKLLLKKHWVKLGAYYGKRIEDEVLNLYVEDLEDLDFDSVASALDSYRRNPKNRNLPLPAQIRDVVSPEPSARDLAEETLGRVIGAIRSYGYVDSEGAKKHIGEEGWTTIQRMGGWYCVCTDPNFNMNVFRAQFLNAAESVHRMEEIGYTGSYIAGRERAKENEISNRKNEALKFLKDSNDLNKKLQ